MSAARDGLFALIAAIPGSGSADWCGKARALLDARDAEVLRAAAAQQWAFAREHWIPTEADSPSAIRKKDHKFGAAERLIGLIDPAAPALMPRHINTIPKGAGFLVRWQLGEETNSEWRASRPGADALAAELRDKGAGQAGRGTAPRCENPKCGRPITRGAQWCSTWCHQASDTQAGKDTASSGESTQPAELTATLHVDRSESRCGNCGKPTLVIGVTHHTDISGWTPRPGGGCGARFTAIAAANNAITPDQLREMRPDLPMHDQKSGARNTAAIEAEEQGDA